MSRGLSVGDVLRSGCTALFCPACGRLVDVYLDQQAPALNVLDLERCPRCWKAFLDVVEPKS